MDVYVLGFGERGEGISVLGVALDLDRAVEEANKHAGRTDTDGWLDWTRDSTEWLAVLANGVDRYRIVKIPVWQDEPGNLVKHARAELERLGESAGYIDSMVRAVAGFASYGHSGGSASIAVEQLYDLLRFRTLTPLTSDAGEWFQHPLEQTGGVPMWQSRRDPAAFSNDGGATWYFVDERDDRRDAKSKVDEDHGEYKSRPQHEVYRD